MRASDDEINENPYTPPKSLPADEAIRDCPACQAQLEWGGLSSFSVVHWVPSKRRFRLPFIVKANPIGKAKNGLGCHYPAHRCISCGFFFLQVTLPTPNLVKINDSSNTNFIPCPACQNTMEEGELSSRTTVHWTPAKKKRRRSFILKANPIGKTRGFGCNYPAHYCPNCRIFLPHQKS